MDINNDFFVQQGWQCPICKRIYSPATAMCFYCNDYKIVTSTTEQTTETPFVTIVPAETTTINKV